VLANTNLSDHFNSAVSKAWVAKGRNMGRAEVIEICHKELFSFQSFKFFPNSVIEWIMHHMHFIWLLIKTGLLHHKWFSDSFDGSAATTRN